jgi:hypothetical protein
VRMPQGERSAGLRYGSLVAINVTFLPSLGLNQLMYEMMVGALGFDPVVIRPPLIRSEGDQSLPMVHVRGHGLLFGMTCAYMQGQIVQLTNTM